MTIHQNATSPSADWAALAWAAAPWHVGQRVTPVSAENGFAAAAKWQRPLVPTAAQRSAGNDYRVRVGNAHKLTVLIRLHHRAWRDRSDQRSWMLLQMRRAMARSQA